MVAGVRWGMQGTSPWSVRGLQSIWDACCCVRGCWGLAFGFGAGGYLQEDILQCAAMMGLQECLLLHCGAGRVEKLQAWGVQFEQFKILKELAVDFFQLLDGLV